MKGLILIFTALSLFRSLSTRMSHHGPWPTHAT